MNVWALIFDPWKNEPVYHFQAREESGYYSLSRTRCGRKIGVHIPWLPTKHVVKFARPCKSCFPEGV